MMDHLNSFDGLAIFRCTLRIAVILTFAVLAGIRGEHLQSRAVAIPGAVVLGMLSCHASRCSVWSSEHDRYRDLRRHSCKATAGP